MSSVTEQVNKTLTGLAELKPNHDSYGAHIVDAGTILRAKNWFRSIAFIDGMTAPCIGPTPGGGVQFEWDRGKIGIEVEFKPGSDDPDILWYEHHGCGYSMQLILLTSLFGTGGDDEPN